MTLPAEPISPSRSEADDHAALIERVRKIKNPAIHVHPHDHAKLVASLHKTDDPCLIPFLAGVPVYVSPSCEEGTCRVVSEYEAPYPKPGSAYNLPAFA